jgi:hypothetical protein
MVMDQIENENRWCSVEKEIASIGRNIFQ